MLTRRCLIMGAGGLLAAASTMARPKAVRAAGALAAEFARLEASSGGRLGVSIIDATTGQQYGYRGDERFPMCSTFKVLACGAVLARVDAGKEDLNRRIRFSSADLVNYSPITKERIGGEGMTVAEICEAGMTRSDNTAANLILASLGGPASVTAFARSLGDQVTRLDRTETVLNEATPGDPRDTTAPNAMAANLRKLTLGDVLSPRSRDQLATWMIANKTGDARLRAGLPKTWRVGDKTGSGDHGTANDIAVAWRPDHAPLIVCVYLTETKATLDECSALIAQIGSAVAAH